jgi:RecA-family ATPase
MLFRCIAAIPNSGGKCIEHFYEDNAAGHAAAEAFARQHDKPGIGVYDCVSPLREPRRIKDNVAQIEGLHVDIDAYKTGRTKEEIIKQLQDELGDVGILSCINSSGRGVHAHFLFREPIEAETPEAENAQRVLKQLVAHLGADPQPAHFAALMRRIGTTNSRAGGGPCKKLLDFGARCELSDVEAYLDLVSDKGVLFSSPEPKTSEDDTFPEYNGPVDVDARLAAMKFEDKSGAGVNATIPSVIASLIWRACHPDEIFDRVMSAISEMVKRDGLQWNMVAEAEKTNERIRCAYHNVFEKEYDPLTGIIPVWLPGEFHEAWTAALAAGKRPSMSRNGAGWHIRSYTIGDKANGTEKNTHSESPSEQSADENPKQNNNPKSPFILLPLNPFEPTELPQRKFLFGKHYQRGTVSGTVAPGGTGKSSLEMVEFVSMASGIDLLNDKQPLDGGPLRVWYHNGEDPMDELKRRLSAICQHYDISLKDLLTSGNFFMTSGNEVPLRVAASYSQVQVQTDHRLVKCIAEQIGDNKIDAAGFDPLVTLHAVSEKDPGKMDGVIRIFAGIADTQNCAIDLSHHTRKLPPGSGDGDVYYDIDDARGVKAITDAMRAVRLLNFMSKQDAENAGLLEMERTSYFRIDRGKANYSAPAKTVTWRRFVNVDLPNGDAVGVITPWLFPGQDGVPSPERLEAERKAEHVFLEILRRRTLAGRFVNERGPYGAPTEFAKEREAKVAKVGKAALAAAMQRLFDRGKIRLEEYISSHRNKANKIVEA